MSLSQLANVSDIWAINVDRVGPLSVASETYAGKPPTMNGKIAIMQLEGTITHKGSFWGGTSAEAFGCAFDGVMADESIAGLVVEIDSPGGEVTGTPELADKIFAARGTKPMVAIANGMADSAAYWIGSAFDKLYMTPSGEVGSVGVWTMHVDQSRWLESEGIGVTVVSSTAEKVEESPFAPLTDEARAEMQARVNSIHEQFTKTVARNRGTSVATVRKDYGNGRALSADKAKAAGMVDGVMTIDQLLSDVSRGAKRGRRTAATKRRIEIKRGGMTARYQRVRMRPPPKCKVHDCFMKGGGLRGAVRHMKCPVKKCDQTGKEPKSAIKLILIEE